VCVCVRVCVCVCVCACECECVAGTAAADVSCLQPTYVAEQSLVILVYTTESRSGLEKNHDFLIRTLKITLLYLYWIFFYLNKIF